MISFPSPIANYYSLCVPSSLSSYNWIQSCTSATAAAAAAITTSAPALPLIDDYNDIKLEGKAAPLVPLTAAAASDVSPSQAPLTEEEELEIVLKDSERDARLDGVARARE